jgi:hypothetical protein
VWSIEIKKSQISQYVVSDFSPPAGGGGGLSLPESPQ